MTILRSGILTVTIIILSIIITMTIPSISIEKSGIAIKNHSAYSQYSYPATAAGVTLANFNLLQQAIGDVYLIQ